jgi:nickel-dependent lactate racemase
MSSYKVTLPWGAEQQELELPESWHLAGILEPANRAGVPDARAETVRSLTEPTSSAKLSERVKAGMKIALVIDDGSRPTPVAKLLPPVLDELKRGGVKLEDVTVIPAVGVHRGMTAGEVAQRTGMEGLKWENQDCDSPSLVFLGTSTRGVPVTVNRTVAEADLVVSIGCIEPHIIASFGGGYKNLFPGVAGRAWIAKNHALNCRPGTFNMVGQPIEKNPMRLDLEEAGRMLKPPVFIINAVLNSALQVVAVVCGDPIEAHRAGTQISASVYGVQVPGQADVVITASHPMDQDLRQGVKAVANTIRAVKPGGVMFTTVRADEGVGVFGLANRKLPLGRSALKTLAPLLLPLVPKVKLQGMGEEDKFFLYFALQSMVQCQLLMYAPTIPAETQANLPFASFVSRPQEAIEVAKQKFPGKAEVLVFPHGGMTYPILPD